MQGSAKPTVSRSVVLAGVMALVIGVAYFGSLDGEFVSDDLQMVVPIQMLNSLAPQNIVEMFTSFHDANYMPLKEVSLAVDRALFGPEPFGHHVTNLLIHIGSAVMLFSILLCLGLSRGTAFFVSLLWAVHPLQVESVAWISERKNVLSGFFFLAAFRAYLSYSDRPRIAAYVVTLSLYACALLSKMNTLVLPAILLAFEATFKMRYRWRDAAASVPMFALGALVAWYNLSHSPIHGEGFHGGSAIVTWLSSSVVVFRYLLHTVLPIGLNSRYHVPLWGTPFHPAVFVSLLGLAAIAVTTVYLIRRKKPEAFWVLWFAITLAPMLNIVPFRSMMQDRYMYLALVGPLALAGSLLDRVTRPEVRRAAGVVASVAVVACVAVTVRQVEHWASPVAFWVRDATVRPLFANEGIYDTDAYPGKLAQLETAAREDPDNPTLLNNLGGLYYMAGQVPKALGYLEEAHRLDPNEQLNLINLGRVYTRQGRFDEAEEKLTRATELQPYDSMACYFLLQLYLGTRDVAKARRTLEQCATLNSVLDRERAELQRLEAAAVGNR